MKFRNDLPETGTGSKNFLKLKDKESVTGIFRGDLHEYFVVWKNNKPEVVDEGTPNAGFRFRVNFVIKDGSNYTPKIFENGKMVYQQLADLHAEYNLQETTIKITRNGTGTDTTYTILPLFKTPPSKETLAFLKKLELLPLGENKPNGEFKMNNADETEIPF